MKALTFKEKQDVLEDLFKKYHRAVLQLKCLEESNFYPSIQFDTVKEKKMYYYSRSTYYRLKTRAMEETLFYFSCL